MFSWNINKRILALKADVLASWWYYPQGKVSKCCEDMIPIVSTINIITRSRKLNEDLKVREVKPAIVNQQCLVYKFQCSLCDTGYVGYTRSRFHERVDGHRQKSSSICKQYFSEHNWNVPPCFLEQFYMLTKCANKFDCLINEMLFMRKLKPSLNVQTDSIRAKVFT